MSIFSDLGKLCLIFSSFGILLKCFLDEKLNMIPKLCVKHELLATVNHIHGNILYPQTEVTHLDICVVKYLNVLFVAPFEPVDKVDDNENTYDIDDQDVVDELRLVDRELFSCEGMENLVGYTESDSKENWFTDPSVSHIKVPIFEV